jgi:hypothetical protein
MIAPKNYEHGKFMLTLGDLLEEKWEVRRFHLWYMEYFHTPTDGEVIVDLHDMHRLLR